ncbi:hypothetical protein PVAND_001988 [Polypedilum vanderplanki]|uniref:ABC transporter domain-containing protein n=3 Tax=Endopterygota TaxID=33392 RepID=A0A9J6BQ46_POLVA|nr:hypothetical protein PVAND_001988 [Polypedilum vanderplanki]
MDQLLKIYEPARAFSKDSIRLIKRCTKPDRREFQKIAIATAIGFCIMGFIGFFVKLIHIPINNIIVELIHKISLELALSMDSSTELQLEKINNGVVSCDYAVKIRNAYKCFQQRNEKVEILKRLNMSIKKKSIYALMGCSGVGKTTLLRSIIAIDTLQSGKIEIFGEPVVQNDPRIGFMPQEISLIENFTVKEMVDFFSVLYKLRTEKINARFKFLSELLELPDDNKFIKECSLGEKRRISFACALVHEPKILILDEPTVGIDAVLRKKIWDFLIELVATSDTTVIISTHYIQESMNSTCVGLMRNGKILIEDKPQDIIQRYNTKNLEEAFLILSDEQDKSLSVSETNEEEFDFLYHVPKQSFNFSMKRLMALLTKNFIHQKRSKTMFMFLCVFPLIVLMSIATFGRDPQGLKIGIVDDEVDNLEQCYNSSLITTFLNETTCYIKDISCRFVNQLKDDVAIKIFYNNLDSAVHDVKNGKIVGLIHFSKEFTNILQQKFNRIEVEKISSLNADYGTINIYLDQSSMAVTEFLRRRLVETYQQYSESLMESCGISKKYGNIPINVQALFGTLQDEFQKYMCVGVAVLCYFFQASSLTSTALIGDRVDGIWNRTLVAGTQPLELILSHLVPCTVLMLIQCTEYFLLLVYYFRDNPNSNIFLSGCLFLLLGICGLIYGISVSVYADSYSIALFLSTVIFIPVLGVAGILWPIEAVPIYLRYIGYSMPFTIPIIAIRGLFFKGLTFCDHIVYLSFIIAILWTIFSFILCYFGLKIRKYHKR